MGTPANEFGPGFSTAYDPAPPLPPGICYPAGTDWSCSYTPEEIANLNPAAKQRSEALAWMMLAALTADQVGTCPITVRPCKAGCASHSSYLTAPVGISGHYVGVSPSYGGLAPFVNGQSNWVNSCGCNSADDCSCTALCEAILPGPVGSIEEVLLDGVVLDPTAYRVDNGNRLVRTDGGCWPACQDMANPSGAQYEPVIHDYPTATITFTREGNIVTVDARPKPGTSGGPAGGIPLPWFASDVSLMTLDLVQGTVSIANGIQYSLNSGPSAVPAIGYYQTDAAAGPVDTSGTFEVTYYRGAAPDQLSLWMAGLLAVEYYKACTADKSCRLPNRLQSVARQGVTYQVAFEEDGTTGIREIDDYVRRLNPYHLKMAPVVVSPQSRRVRSTTWSR